MKRKQQSALTHIDTPYITSTWAIKLVLSFFEDIILALPYKQAFYTAVWIYTCYDWDSYVGALAPYKG
eukprot:8087269-Ditylum_brightwellii.AAC.1